MTFAEAAQLLEVTEDELLALVHGQPPGFPFPRTCEFRGDLLVIEWADDQLEALRAYAAKVSR